MYTSKSKKTRALRLMAVYTLMTISVIAVVTVLVFLMLGYRFNRVTGIIQQGGLVQFDTLPHGARVQVNDIKLADQTPSKITLNPGNYTVSMQRKNYQPWQKDVTVTAGTVLRLNYGRLIPIDLKTSSVMQLKSLAGMRTRIGQNKIVLLALKTKPTLVEVDIGGDAVKTTDITIPTSVYHAAKKQSFELGEYSRDDKHLLVEHHYGDKTELLYVDMRNPENSLNLTNLFAINPVKTLFDNRSNNGLFVLLPNGEVRSINLSSQTISRILVANAYDISLQGDRALWYSAKLSSGVVATGYLTPGTTTPRVVASYKTSQPVFVGAGDYYGKTYLSTVVDSKLTVASIDNFPASNSTAGLRTTLLATENLPAPVTDLTIYSGGRFVTMLHKHAQTVYDIELGSLASVPLTDVSSTRQTPPVWLGGYYFYDDAGGNLRLYEYDGTNQHVITRVAPGFQAVISQNNKYIYSVGKTKTGFQLQRTLLNI